MPENQHQTFFISDSDLENVPKYKFKPVNNREKDMSTESSVLPDGTPNFECPCLGNMPHGPCGQLFRKSFSCWAKYKDAPEDDPRFYYECQPKFVEWGKCAEQYKKVYNDPSVFNRPSHLVRKILKETEQGINLPKSQKSSSIDMSKFADG